MKDSAGVAWIICMVLLTVLAVLSALGADQARQIERLRSKLDISKSDTAFYMKAFDQSRHLTDDCQHSAFAMYSRI